MSLYAAGEREGEPSAAIVAAQTAEAVGLSYVRDGAPGIRRVRHGKGFRYVAPDGTAVREPRTLTRIRMLVIPPAWTHVWICTAAHGHLQATGRDARGRKQYRYHSEWRGIRDANKYERLGAFVRALPRIRRKVRADLALPGLPRDKVLAAVTRLLETTFIRIGNERYARENGSFGLTTLRNRHVRVCGAHIRFQFRGKSGKEHALELTDARLARIVRRCRDLPGYELFQYVENGAVHSVSSDDINAYLKQVAGEDYTAKDFRTWGGTLLAGLAFGRQSGAASETQATRAIAQVIRDVASELRNTAAICRKCYIHPRVIEAYHEGSLCADAAAAHKGVRGLRREESRILQVLECAVSRRARAVLKEGRRAPRPAASAAAARRALSQRVSVP